MAVVLRPIGLADVAHLELLERDCFVSPWTRGLLQGALSRADFCGIIAIDEGQALGYVCGRTLFEDAEIDRIAVAASRRQEGLGTRLMAAFEALVKEKHAQRILLEVRLSNAPALALYSRCGFESVRTRQRYYADGEDALEMQKRL